MVNPFSFRPGPVTFWTTATYLALLIPIIVINERTPPAPTKESPVPGINLTQAWLDLTTITRAYHPYNSHYNDEVRAFLLRRIASILDGAGVPWTTDGPDSAVSNAAVTVFDDMTSNCTFLMSSGVVPNPDSPRVAAYFEGTNILVYIRGKADDQGRWWETEEVHGARRTDRVLTLVNAHYDSVSTGYGATDDGMGVVTCLQLIQYFTSPGNQPERGVVIMLNNGEEDYLYGARALGQHPLQPHIHTFLNLEGAGAGGRAILFRTTDREVTAAYAGSPDPFGTVIGSDAFGLGFIRSGTDYSVLYDVYGQRGLDLAFFKPRARYHTNQDDARHASAGSLWHMLSAAIHTTARLAADTGDTFVGPRPGGARGGKVPNGRPSDGVWFDLFGKAFVLFALRGMFAWSLTVLVAAPLVLVLVSYLLHRADRYYLFSSAVTAHGHPDEEPVPVGGWKGFFRFPFALVVAGSLTVGSAFLMRKVNPFIIYSSRYTVLAMMVSLFYFTFWAIMRGADFARPSALHRVYVQIWLFILGWAALVAVTVAEDRLGIGAGYMFVFFESAAFLALLIALCELFALPKKTAWARHAREAEAARDIRPEGSRAEGDDTPSQLLPPPVPHQESSSPPGTRQSNSSAANNRGSAAAEEDDENADTEEPTERTPLVGGNAAASEPPRTTFATTYRRSISAIVHGARRGRRQSGGSSLSSSWSAAAAAAVTDKQRPFEHEQAWSARLPSAWTWLPQFLLLAPFAVVLVAQTALVLLDAVHQTGADGSALLLPYLLAASAAALLVLPLAPFVHRATHHVSVALMAVFAAALVYNLVAFPFGEGNARYKAYFVQTLDLDGQHGSGGVDIGGGGEGVGSPNRVCLTGVEEYVRAIIAQLPSASGQEVSCGASKREGLRSCCFDGDRLPPPNLRAPSSSPSASTSPSTLPATDWEGYSKGLVSVNATRLADGVARIEIDAENTRACFIEFGRPVSAVRVRGSSGWDERFGQFPESGVTNLRLWRRKWEGPWVVEVDWQDGDGDDPKPKAPGFAGDDGSPGEHKEEDMPGDSRGDDSGELRRRDGGPQLPGKVVCMWSDANVPGTIPALDEALAFAPAWAAITKLSEGLVEGRKGFEV